MKNIVIEAGENLPTINVGTIVQAYGFPMLSGFKGENFYKVVKIEDDKAYFQRCNEIGDLSNIAGEAFPADIKNVQTAIKSVETGISSNGLKIWKENKQAINEIEMVPLLISAAGVIGSVAFRAFLPTIISGVISGAVNIANDIKNLIAPANWVKFLKNLHNNDAFNRQFIEYIEKRKQRGFAKLSSIFVNPFEELPEFQKALDKFVKENNVEEKDIPKLKKQILNGFRNTLEYQKSKVLNMLKSKYPEIRNNPNFAESLNEMIASDKTDGRLKQMMNKMKSSYRSINGINFDTLNKTYLFAFGNKSDADRLEKDFKVARSRNPEKSVGKFEFIRSADYPNDNPPTFVKQFKINETIYERVGTSDVNYNRLLKMYDQGGNFTKKKIASLVLHDPNSSKADIFDRLRDYSYSEIKDIMKDLRVWVKESLNEANMLVYNVNPDACEAFLRKYPKVRTAMTGIARKNTDLMRGYKQFLSFKDKNEKLLGGRAETTKATNFGEKTFYKYDWMGTQGWAEIYQYIDGVKESINENFQKFNTLKMAVNQHEKGAPYYDKTRLINIFNQLSSSDQVKAKKQYSGYFGKSINESASTYKDWDEFVNPDHILVTLKNGKKLKISRSNIKGGNSVYQAILKAFNDNNYKITDKVVGAMVDKLRDKDEDGKELGRMGAFVSESVNEAKSYYVGYNKGRGQGKGVFKDKYKSYGDAEKQIKKISNMMGGTINQTAYYVADEKGNLVNEAKGAKTIQKEFDKVVGEIETTLDAYKKAKGTPKEKALISKLKELNAKKKSLASELEDKISNLYKDAELKMESVERELIKKVIKEEILRIKGLQLIEKYLYPKGISQKPGFEKTTLGLDKMLKYAKTFQKFYDEFKRKFKKYPNDSDTINQLKDLWSMYHEEPALAEELEGGASEGMSIEKIAEKHKIDINDLLQQFKKGIRVEMEHTTDTGIAKEITLDHLAEDPMYYEKLSKIGL